MATAPSDTLEVVMIARITGDRYVETGRTVDEKNGTVTSVMERSEWPLPGQKIRLPRAEALSLIHNELAYPATLKSRPKDRTEAMLAAGASA